MHIQSVLHGESMSHLTDLSWVEYGEEPGKHGGVDIDGQESKHPRQAKEWKQNNGCFQQGSGLKLKDNWIPPTHLGHPPTHPWSNIVWMCIV